jgi:signal transduction histidine kinase
VYDELFITAMITVRDSEMWIAPQEQEKIFKRFYRVDRAHSGEQGGVGLGLAISERVVLQHRGTISVESRLGEGTAFRVRLPLIAVKMPSPLLAD